MTNHRGKVLIAGGGIAGLACAIALRRAGLDPAVVEARPASDCGAGVFLTLAANGLDALRTLGIEPADLGGFDTDRIGLYLSDGTRLTEFPTAPKRHDGLVAQTVRRSGVYAALRREAERLGIATQYGRRVVAARPVAAGVALDFDDGQACVASLLVGADGVHSRVRRLIDARAPDPRETDLMNTAAIARDIDVEGEPGAMRMYFGRRCFFAYVPRRRGEVWWFANPPAPFHVDHGEPGKWKGRLADMFTEDAFPAREIILATDLVPAPWPTCELARVPVWHQGRMVIVDDAAHAAAPSSGQGASMAIEDAIELARCLRDHSSVEAALARYEALRRQRVERVVRQGQHNAGGKSPNAFGRIMRDAFLRVWFWAGPQHIENLQWLYNHHIDWHAPASAAEA